MLLVLVAIIATNAALWIGFRQRTMLKARRVDSYALSIEQHDGFHFVHLKLETSDGRLSTYELEPQYGHVLSDELCVASAMAIRDRNVSAT